MATAQAGAVSGDSSLRNRQRLITKTATTAHYETVGGDSFQHRRRLITKQSTTAHYETVSGGSGQNSRRRFPWFSAKILLRFRSGGDICFASAQAGTFRRLRLDRDFSREDRRRSVRRQKKSSAKGSEIFVRFGGRRRISRFFPDQKFSRTKNEARLHLRLK